MLSKQKQIVDNFMNGSAPERMSEGPGANPPGRAFARALDFTTLQLLVAVVETITKIGRASCRERV